MFIDNVTMQDLPDNFLRQIYTYWQSKKGERDMPSRKEIRPEEIHRLLPYIVLIDVEQEPLRFKARLVGSEIVNVIGRDFTGMYFDDFPNIDKLISRLEGLVANRHPYFVGDNVQWPAKAFMEYYALAMPLSDNGKDVNIIMYGMYYPDLNRGDCRQVC